MGTKIKSSYYWWWNWIISLLRGLKKYPLEITAIVTVADDGGSSGVIRDYINVVPPGDIRNCLCALSPMSSLQKDIFQYRFKSDDQIFCWACNWQFNYCSLTEMHGNNIFDAIRYYQK